MSRREAVRRREPGCSDRSRRSGLWGSANVGLSLRPTLRKPASILARPQGFEPLDPRLSLRGLPVRLPIPIWAVVMFSERVSSTLAPAGSRRRSGCAPDPIEQVGCFVVKLI